MQQQQYASAQSIASYQGTSQRAPNEMRDSYFPIKLDADRSEVKPYHHHTAIKLNAIILITWKFEFRSVTTQ